MHYWPARRSPKRGKDRRTHDRIKGKRSLGPEIDEMKDTIDPPIGSSRASTPLTASIDKVLMQIKDEGALTFPGKLKGDPSKRPRDKYCRFHRDHEHDIANYYDLK